MSDQRYIILWKAGLGRSKRRLSARPAEQQSSQAETTNRITVAALSKNEVSELRRDPNIECAAASLPISLVRPMSASKVCGSSVKRAKVAGGSWGVLDVASSASASAGASVKVAILDTGVDVSHAAFKEINFTCRNFSTATSDSDVNGHGTHCAGIIFGRDQNGNRIGVARGVREVVVAKVLDDDGFGDSESIVSALQWVRQQGAKVASLSVGIDFTKLVSIFEEDGKSRLEAISRALAAYRDSVRMFDSLIQLLKVQTHPSNDGIVVVAAAGNESSRKRKRPYVIDVGIPAAALGALSVGAVGRNADTYNVAPFSNINPDVSAPGVDIVSAKSGGGLMAMSGTSMAAPHVAGVTVLWWERLMQTGKKVSADLVIANVLASCSDSGFATHLTHADRGSGIVREPR